MRTLVLFLKALDNLIIIFIACFAIYSFIQVGFFWESVILEKMAFQWAWLVLITYIQLKSPKEKMDDPYRHWPNDIPAIKPIGDNEWNEIAKSKNQQP